MSQLFNDDNFIYRSVEVYQKCCSYLRVLVIIRNFYNGGRYNYTGDLPRYVLDRLFDNLTDKSYWDVDVLRIIIRETKSTFQLTIGVFSITFVMYSTNDAGEWEIYRIPEYDEDEIRIAKKLSICA